MNRSADDVTHRVAAAIALAEERLPAATSVETMARAACYSIFHLCRRFSQVAHLTAHDYVMRRRLTLSTRAVCCSDQPILQIAMEHGFQSPEGFARAFRRMFGVLPSTARGAGAVDQRRRLAALGQSELALLSRFHSPCIEAHEKATELSVRPGQATPEEPWAVVCTTEAPAFSTRLHYAGRARTVAEPAPTQDDRRAGRFATIVMPPGRYATIVTGSEREVEDKAGADAVGLIAELYYSVIWPANTSDHPPQQVFVHRTDGEQKLLAEVER